MKRLKITVLILFLSFFTGEVLAQNEVLRERNSLYGISEFGVAVNIEKPKSLMEDVTLSVDSVRTLLVDELNELPVTILEDETLRDSDQFPILHLHVNIMNASLGAYPFTAELKFYQPIKLPLNNDVQTMGATWHDSFIGVVTPDLIDFIAAQSVNLAGNFKIDYQSVNSR